MSYLNEIVCPCCGGITNKKGICKYCGQKNKAYEEIEKLIENNNIEEYYIVILNKIIKGNKLNNIEDIVFRKLLHYNFINDNYISDSTIIFNILKGYNNISYETFEELLKFSVKKFMRMVASDKIEKYNPLCFIEDTNNEILGETIGNNEVIIIRELCQLFYNQKNPELIITVYHEMRHVMQNVMIKAGFINKDIITMIKEKIIIKEEEKSQKTKSYYKNNYNNISFELDARKSSVLYFVNWLKYNNVILTNDEIQYFWKKENIVENTDIRKIVNGTNILYTTIDDIFENIIMNFPEYLDLYPQLKIEYIIDNNKVRRKTIEELKYYRLNNEFDTDTIQYIDSLIKDSKTKSTVSK